MARWLNDEIANVKINDGEIANQKIAFVKMANYKITNCQALVLVLVIILDYSLRLVSIVNLGSWSRSLS